MTQKHLPRRNFLRAASLTCVSASVASASDMKGSPERRAVAADNVNDNKFNADGQANRWPGCTLICHIPPNSQAFEALSEARDLMRSHPAMRRKLSWLPERSYHVTVCDLLNESRRLLAWPRELPPDAPMDVACAFAAGRLRDFDVESNAPFRLKLDRELAKSIFRAPGKLRTAVPWVPADEPESRRIYRLRRRVYEALGIASPNVTAYAFHTTLAYEIEVLAPNELDAYRDRFVRAMEKVEAAVPVLELGVPEFCVFESMYFFARQFYLRAMASSAANP